MKGTPAILRVDARHSQKVFIRGAEGSRRVVWSEEVKKVRRLVIG